MSPRSPMALNNQDMLIYMESLNRRMEQMEIVQADFEQRLARLIEKNDIYLTLLDESSDPIFMFFPDGTYRYANRAFAEGVNRPQAEVVGRKIWDVFPHDEAEKRFTVVKWVFEHGLTRNIEVRVPREDGDRYYITTAKPILDESGRTTSVICISRDITDRKQMELALRKLSTNDVLTGVLNRVTFFSELERISSENLFPAGMIIVDLDHLGLVNEKRGYHEGDLYLQKIAALLRDTFPENILIARIGEDEFSLVLPRTEPGAIETMVGSLRSRIAELWADPLHSLSIGWCSSTGDVRLADLLPLAKEEMLADKARHRSGR